SGTASGTTVSSGGSQYVYSGGTAIGTTVNGSGTQTIEGDGTASGTQVSLGGIEYVLSGGLASGTILGDDGYEIISSGGVASGTVAGPASQESVSSGGKSVDTLVNSGGGKEIIYAGGSATSTTVENGGTEYVSSGGTATGTVIGNSGAEIISSGGVSDGTVINSGGFEGVFSGSVTSGTELRTGGTIDEFDWTYSPSGTAHYNSSTHTLTVDAGSNTYTLNLSGDYTGEYFHLAEDSLLGTDITVDNTPCYCRGTLILTDHGEVPVEDLTIGDRLITASGNARSLKWIGTRSYSGRFASHNRDVLPITFKAGALDGALPKRDLHVSPLHAMFIDDVLIPAFLLVNGTSITQAERVDMVEYFHLELETHDVIIAEGALSESFVDDDSRGMFHNAKTYDTLYPDSPIIPPRYCAPRVEDGELLEAIRNRLLRRTNQQQAA
ncbi:MAG TPA: Hint domain-containing protein, partial [Acidiphilium sp.]